MSEIIIKKDQPIKQYLADYEREQREGSKSIQQANATTFSQIALTTPWKAKFRDLIFKIISKLDFVKRRMIEADTLTNQTIYFKEPRVG